MTYYLKMSVNATPQKIWFGLSAKITYRKNVLCENHYDRPWAGSRELILFVYQKAAPEWYYCS